MGDDRLEQKGRGPCYDVLRCRPFGVDFELAGAAKCADNLVMSAMYTHCRRRFAGRSFVEGIASAIVCIEDGAFWAPTSAKRVLL
jgi:hypothetical protein